MCGRYTLQQTTQDLLARFAVQLALFEVSPRYNIAPSQEIAVVRANGERRLEALKWGLVPFWAKDLKKLKPMINARMETIAEKPTFKDALIRRRCLIPADGFFEWKTDGEGKTPMHIRMRDRRLFAFAGLYDRWRSPDGQVLETCTIITVPANGWITQVHDRMPAILRQEDEERWLDTGILDPGRILTMVAPYPAAEMEAVAVSRAVNSPKKDTPECVQPVAQGDLHFAQK